MKKKTSWLPIVLYVLAVVTGIYALYALIGAVQYVSGYVAQGYISYSTGFGEIVGYYITTAGPHIFYAVAFGVMGYVVKALQCCGCHGKTEEEAEEEVVVESAVSAAPVAGPGPRYCKNCYKVFSGDAVPEVCPECGEPMF